MVRTPGRFKITRDTLRPRIKNFPQHANKTIANVFEEHRRLMQNDAKINAPWKDRTGDARRGLTATRRKEGNKHTLTLFHMVEYGIWLEVRFGGKNAIIEPTIDKFYPVVIRQIAQRLF